MWKNETKEKVTMLRRDQEMGYRMEGVKQKTEVVREWRKSCRPCMSPKTLGIRALALAQRDRTCIVRWLAIEPALEPREDMVGVA